jgi:hypothetical protein
VGAAQRLVEVNYASPEPKYPVATRHIGFWGRPDQGLHMLRPPLLTQRGHIAEKCSRCLQMPAVQRLRPCTVRSAGLLLLPHVDEGVRRWRLAEAPAERAIEMRNVTKADPKRDIDDRQMQMVRVSQHREGTLKPAFCKVLGERLSGPIEQFLHVSPRYTERPSDIVQIEIGIAEALRDLRQDRLQPGCLHTTVRNDICSFGGRPERRGHEIK